LKANANKNRSHVEKVRRNALKYLDDLDKAIEEDRKANGMNPFPVRE